MDLILIECGFVILGVMMVLLIVICTRISEISEQIQKIEYKISYRDWDYNGADEKIYTVHKRR